MPDSIESLQRLAERLLGWPNPDGSLPTVRLFPGRLPEGSDLDIPLPPGCAVVGGLTRTQDPKQLHIEVALDAPGGETEILEFYERELAQRGWRRTTPFPGRGGFTTLGFGTAHTFSQDEDGRMLTITIAERDGRRSEVGVRTQTVWASPTASPFMTRRSATTVSESGIFLGAPIILPALHPPMGVAFWSLGGGSCYSSRGGGYVTAQAQAQTDVPVLALEEHFAGQLVAAGWTRVDGGTAAPLAWSTWMVHGDSESQGYLFVIAQSKDRRFVSLQVVSATFGSPVRTTPSQPTSAGP